MSLPSNAIDQLLNPATAGTATKYYNTTSSLFLSQQRRVPGSPVTQLVGNQLVAMDMATRSWEDVANVDWRPAVDDASLAQRSMSQHFVVTAQVFDFTCFCYRDTDGYYAWDNNLPTQWTRIAIGDLQDNGNLTTLGLNSKTGYNNNYQEITLDTQLTNEDFLDFGLAWQVLVHELGHSMALTDITNNTSFPDMYDRDTYTIMSYNDSFWPSQTPMIGDIQAVQRQYGANTTTRSGNDRYGFFASFSDNRDAGYYDLFRNDNPHFTIYDTGGIDSIDLSYYRSNQYLDLTPGRSSLIGDNVPFDFSTGTNSISSGNVWIYDTTVIENATGGIGSDTLLGNSVANHLTGGDGNDTLQGNQGNDFLLGGNGEDLAKYSASRGSYALRNNADGTITVTSLFSGSVTGQGDIGDGSDILSNIEQIQFSDLIYSLYDLGLDDIRGTASTTANINVGGNIRGFIETQGDHDWFGVNLVAGRTYRVRIDGSGANAGTLGDSYLELRRYSTSFYNSTTLAYDDDSGPDRDSELIFKPTASGLYYLDVSGYGHNVGSYTLRITVDAAASIGSDVNGDGTADILFRDSTGDLGLYRMQNGAVQSWQHIGGSSTAYQVAGVGDFNGDGTSDILFRDSTGALGLYKMQNGAVQSWQHIGGSSATYEVAGIGDFNGDGTSDILFRDSTGDLGFYEMQNGALESWQHIGGSSSAYQVAGIGDFNGDGTSDILFRSSTGDLGLYRMQNGAVQSWQHLGGSSAAYEVAGTGDFTGDGTADILFRDSTGDLGLYRMQNGAVQSWQHIGGSSTAYQVAGVGDLTGDGTSDILFRDSTGDLGLYRMQNGAVESWQHIGGASTAYSIPT